MKLIAEIGQNHNADIEIAKKLMRVSKIAGFDYCKLQKRSPKKCTPEHKKNELRMTPWGEMTYLEYREKIEFGEKEYDVLYKENIPFFASVWDIDSAAFMKKYTSIVKIPSAMITNLELLDYCKNYSFRIMSTGMSTEKQIDIAVETLKPDVIMHTNSCYPAPHNELNLEYINHLRRKWSNVEIGYSGHEVNLQPTLTAVVLGATWIERHITIDRHLWGSDQLASVEPEGMFKLKKAIDQIIETLKGDCDRIIFESEKGKMKSLRKKDLLEL